MIAVSSILCSASEAARTLRKLAVFKIVPMLNPDGVGRQSLLHLAGHDLNRRGMHLLDTSPTIYHLKEMIRSLVKKGRQSQDSRSDGRSKSDTMDTDGNASTSTSGDKSAFAKIKVLPSSATSCSQWQEEHLHLWL